METNNFQSWMNENGYTDVRFYPRNTSAYGVIDMMESASKAVTLYVGGHYTMYQDSVESFREECISSTNS